MRACAFLVLCLALPGGHASDLLKVSNGQYNPFGQAMEMMMDAMESYGRNRAWEDTLSSYAWQTQPWSWGTMSGMSPWGSMPGMGTQIPGQNFMPGMGTQVPGQGLMPGMGTQVPGQSSMQQMFQNAPQAARSMGGTFGSPGAGYPGMMPWPGAATGGGQPFQGAGTALDGVWQGNSGEILLVRNGHFRLYAGRDSYNDGRLAVRGDRLALTDPSTGVTREYEYATHEGRLVLRDEGGNLLLYRRVPPESVRSLLQ